MLFSELRYRIAWQRRERFSRDSTAYIHLGAWLSEMLCGWLE